MFPLVAVWRLDMLQADGPFSTKTWQHMRKISGVMRVFEQPKEVAVSASISGTRNRSNPCKWNSITHTRWVNLIHKENHQKNRSYMSPHQHLRRHRVQSTSNIISTYGLHKQSPFPFEITEALQQWSRSFAVLNVNRLMALRVQDQES